ncbi:putative zinc finger BED domain-containing protein RICESLEEPER 2-like [Iris pallida]|uniref:Zinc finger BED domain-containing protein RICESLEEPER 2-like n=1 Tax=Iris pallida TaxID=29817 RepID=A0AAX6EJG1_IRIPA|nr:putative zinc finger BED domain-containing protein RICESLEEPER 2-like [Iris pallida]
MDASEDGDEVEGGNGTTDDAGRKRKSPVWNEFSKITVMVKGVPVKKGECKYCKKNIAINKSGSTTQFIRHMQKCYVRLASFKKQKVLTGTDFIKVGAATNGNLGIFKFLKQSVRENMAKMIIVHEYPFRMVEHEFFVLFCRMLNAQFEKISRAIIRNECIKLHAYEKNKFKIMLTSVEKISLTSDLWTSNQTIGYMCLTAHFMNSEWILQKPILNFCSLPPPNTGFSIADAIFHCLLDWGIESKVSTITLDNASSNDSVVRYLKDSFSRIGKLFFKGKIFHVRCCVHILNLMVQDGLHEIKDVIQNIRKSVKYLKMSSSRLHNFAEIAKQVNISVVRRLVFDVPTRWNSTYAMLESALIFRDVFPRYGDRDNNHAWLLIDLDCEKAENVCKILEVFHDASNVFSGVSYPTSNLFLPEI